jgi:hypothetical protein
MRLSYALLGLAAVAAILAALSGVGAWQEGRGHAGEIQSAIHQGEAQAHATTAQSVPNHAAEVQALRDRADATQAGLDRARSEVARLRKLLAPKPGVPVPDPAGAGDPDIPPVAADHRDEVIAAQSVLIQAQDVRIGALEAQVTGLETAYSDEQARSEQFRLAYESERKATAAQAVATKAWKDAVGISRNRGRAEGAIVWELIRRVAGAL